MIESFLRCHTVKGYHEFSRDPTPHRDLRHCVGDAGCHLRTPTASFRSVHPSRSLRRIWSVCHYRHERSARRVDEIMSDMTKPTILLPASTRRAPTNTSLQSSPVAALKVTSIGAILARATPMTPTFTTVKGHSLPSPTFHRERMALMLRRAVSGGPFPPRRHRRAPDIFLARPQR